MGAGTHGQSLSEKIRRFPSPLPSLLKEFKRHLSNKKTVEKYIDGFRKSDHQQILSCLTDDVEWDIPGMFHATGMEEFDKQIENEAFVGSPALTITRMIEENDVVIAEGTVRVKKREGGFFNAVFCDAFTMREGKIKHLISYLMEFK